MMHVLTGRGVGFLQRRTYLPQANAERRGLVRVHARHPVWFSGSHPRTGHETGQQYCQGRDSERDTGPGHVLRHSAHRAHDDDTRIVFIERDNDNVPPAIDRVRIAFTVALPSRHATIDLRKKHVYYLLVVCAWTTANETFSRRKLFPRRFIRRTGRRVTRAETSETHIWYKRDSSLFAGKTRSRYDLKATSESDHSERTINLILIKDFGKGRPRCNGQLIHRSCVRTVISTHLAQFFRDTPLSVLYRIRLRIIQNATWICYVRYTRHYFV